MIFMMTISYQFQKVQTSIRQGWSHWKWYQTWGDYKDVPVVQTWNFSQGGSVSAAWHMSKAKVYSISSMVSFCAISGLYYLEWATSECINFCIGQVEVISSFGLIIVGIYERFLFGSFAVCVCMLSCIWCMFSPNFQYQSENLLLCTSKICIFLYSNTRTTHLGATIILIFKFTNLNIPMISGNLNCNQKKPWLTWSEVHTHPTLS